MTINDPPHPDLENDQVLDSLIRECQADAEEPAVPASVVAAYLRGEANPEEVQMVRQALATSRRFRDEVLYLAGLYDPRTQALFDRTPAPRGAGQESDSGGAGISGSLRRHFGGHPLRGRRMPLFGLVAVAASLVVALLLRGTAPTSLPGELAGHLSREQFQTDTPRGGSLPLPEAATAREAAILAITGALREDGGRWTFRTAAQSSEPAGSSAWLLGGRPLPAEFSTAAAEPEFWIFALPTLALHRYPAPDGEPREIAPPPGDRLFGVATYRQNGRYLATVPRELIVGR
jgi:hypothetical protein